MNFKLAIRKMFFERLNDNISVTFDLQLGAFLPVRASEQGNVIESVHIYIYIYMYKKIVIERTRDLIYLNFVATVSALLMNPLPDRSSLVSSGQTLYQAAPLETNTSLLQRFTAESNHCQELRRNAVP